MLPILILSLSVAAGVGLAAGMCHLVLSVMPKTDP